MKINCFFTEATENYPQLWNKLALLKSGFFLFKEMHSSVSVPQAHKGLIHPETPKWPEGLSVHVQTLQWGQRVGEEPLVSLGV